MVKVSPSMARKVIALSETSMCQPGSLPRAVRLAASPLSIAARDSAKQGAAIRRAELRRMRKVDRF